MAGRTGDGGAGVIPASRCGATAGQRGLCMTQFSEPVKRHGILDEARAYWAASPGSSTRFCMGPSGCLFHSKAGTQDADQDGNPAAMDASAQLEGTTWIQQTEPLASDVRGLPSKPMIVRLQPERLPSKHSATCSLFACARCVTIL